MNNYIYEYYQKIKDGSIIVGSHIKKLYDIIIQGLDRKEYLLDLKKANKAIRFIESFCHHSEGKLAPQLIKLELWQKAIVSTIFGIVDPDGLRHFREVLIVVGRKNGKTLFASAIMAYMTYMDGEYGARTYCVAPKLDQADLVYNNFWQTIEQEQDLLDITKRRKSDYYVESTNSSVKKIAFNHKKSDGFNPSLTICDEVASWQGEQGLKQYEVMKSALGSRSQPLIISITTSGYINDGIYDELVKRSTRFLKGESRETRLLPFLYMIDFPEKWNDINELQKSNPNLGVSVSVDYLLEEIAVAEQSYSKKAEFLTKYCNIKQSSSLAWLDAIIVQKACGKGLRFEDFENCYCVGGIDLSRTTDLTACCAVIEKQGVLNVFAQFFLPAEKIEEASVRDGLPYKAYIARGLLTPSGENSVDYEDVYAWFRILVEKYKIYPLKVGYDRYSSTYLVNQMKQYGFHMDDVYQGFNLTAPIRSAEGLFLDRRINIGDNDLLKVHLLNTALKTDNENNKVRLVKLSPTDHIDGVASLIDALTVRDKYSNEIGQQLINEGK